MSFASDITRSSNKKKMLVSNVAVVPLSTVIYAYAGAIEFVGIELTCSPERFSI